LKLKKSKEFLEALKADDDNSTQREIVKIIQGGNGEQGTFGIREVALEVARWISPKFSVWCNKQIDTLLQTGKVELKSQLPTDSLEASEQLANTVLRLVATVKQNKLQLEEAKKESQHKQMLIENKETTIEQVITMKAKEYKTINAKMKADIGKEINFYVKKLYLSIAGSYSEAHKLARREFRFDTGEDYLGAKLTSLETKKIYLKWLRGQDINTNQLQIA
jgi:hypothetical protein